MKWKRVEVADDFLAQNVSGGGNVEFLGGLEELVESDGYDQKQLAKPKKPSDPSSDDTETKKPKKKKKKKVLKLAESTTSVSDDVPQPQPGTSSETTAAKADQPARKKKKRKLKTGEERAAKKRQLEEIADQKVEIEPDVSTKLQENDGIVTTDNDAVIKAPPDMSVWANLGVPDPILKALAESGFTTPTDIQRVVLPHALQHHLDIVGAAETGSGKTLAFGIPVVAGLLDSCPEPIKTEDGKLMKTNGPLALIVTPTRELAMQVDKHINVILKHTALTSIVIVGGLAQQKQERLLKRRPEILIATPGRLWGLMEQFSMDSSSYLGDLSGIKYVVVDEADRMVEHGHFEELTNILNKVKAVRRRSLHVQTLVFSATLTYVHPAPKRGGQSVGPQLSAQQKLAELMDVTGVRPNAYKTVDLTRKFGTAESVVETRINCDSLADKDSHLVYFLRQYPGRTLIFTNSIDASRRCHALLNKLAFPVHMLHAKMHQKQRLKNLERFSDNSNAILLATDVAARGLDIRAIQHVIHYQVPKTAEVYVHRSGRTARATASGLSVMLVDALDAQYYKRICNNLNRNQDLSLFPIASPTALAIVRAQVRCAAELESCEHQLAKATASKRWFRNAAQQAEIELDPRLGIGEKSDSDDDDDDGGENQSKAARLKRRVKSLATQLKQLMGVPLPQQQTQLTKYPNQALVQSWQKALPDALGAVVSAGTQKHSKTQLKKMGVNIGRLKKNKQQNNKRRKKFKK